MELTTYLQADELQKSLVYLKQIKTELATPSTQKIIILTKRSLPSSPPAALTTSLDTVEDFLLGQATVAIQDQIDALQLSFDLLQDPES